MDRGLDVEAHRARLVELRRVLEAHSQDERYPGWAAAHPERAGITTRTLGMVHEALSGLDGTGPIPDFMWSNDMALGALDVLERLTSGVEFELDEFEPRA